MYIDINTATSPFFEDMLVSDFIDRFLATRLRPMHEIEQALKGVRVRIEYSVFQPLVAFPNPSSRFCLINCIGLPIKQQEPNRHRYPQATSVYDWYDPASTRYPNRADSPNQNLPLSGHEFAINVEKDPHDYPHEFEWYPATQLRIVQWHPIRGRLLPPQTSQMINTALKDPGPHRNRILGSAANSGGSLRHFGFAGPFTNNNQAGLNAMNMTAGTQFIQIPARWLGAPRITYSNASHDPQIASWDLRGVKFATLPSPKIAKFPILNMSGQTITQVHQNLIGRTFYAHGLFQNQQPNMPMYFGTPGQYQPTSQYEGRVVGDLMRVRNNHPNDTALVIIRQKDFDEYSAIKRVAELRLGMKVVCCTFGALNKRNGLGDEKTIFNIGLKYNLESEHDNHHLQHESLNHLRRSPNGAANTIVLGADVTHPEKEAHKAAPSIASVVGSTDDNFVHFPGSMRFQRDKKEDIVDLAEMVMERLIDWAERHGRNLPQKMLFYRDGVSESQYDIIRRRELPQLQVAMNLAYRYFHPPVPGQQGPPQAPAPLGPAPAASAPGPRLSKRDKEKVEKLREEDRAETIENDKNNVAFDLTFIVVGKRHHTRFYATTNAQHTKPGGRNENPRPGLAADQVITHPSSTDFYLQSHQATRGTGRSAHYFALRNNMQLTIHNLQSITHTFCYAYARATKGVSYCAPAYYADRLCDRGRTYLRQ